MHLGFKVYIKFWCLFCFPGSSEVTCEQPLCGASSGLPRQLQLSAQRGPSSGCPSCPRKPRAHLQERGNHQRVNQTLQLLLHYSWLTLWNAGVEDEAPWATRRSSLLHSDFRILTNMGVLQLGGPDVANVKKNNMILIMFVFKTKMYFLVSLNSIKIYILVSLKKLKTL